MSDFETYTAMLTKARIGFGVETDFDKEYAAPGAEKRVIVYGGSGMHAEADFDAAGNLLDLGRLEHY